MIIYQAPVRSIGRFFKDLSPKNKTAALQLARRAHRLPKIRIEQEVLRLEDSIKYSNIV